MMLSMENNDDFAVSFLLASHGNVDDVIIVGADSVFPIIEFDIWMVDVHAIDGPELGVKFCKHSSKSFDA